MNNLQSITIEKRKARLIKEARRVSERMNRLNKFMGGDEFPSLDRVDKDLLYSQQRVMSRYLQILGKRIERLGGQFSHEDKPEKAYRMLDAGEIIAEGDEWESMKGKWESVDRDQIGKGLYICNVGRYRRPVEIDYSLDEESTFHQD